MSTLITLQLKITNVPLKAFCSGDAATKGKHIHVHVCTIIFNIIKYEPDFHKVSLVLTGFSLDGLASFKWYNS